MEDCCIKNVLILTTIAREIADVNAFKGFTVGGKPSLEHRIVHHRGVVVEAIKLEVLKLGWPLDERSGRLRRFLVV